MLPKVVLLVVSACLIMLTICDLVCTLGFKNLYLKICLGDVLAKARLHPILQVLAVFFNYTFSTYV